MEEEKTQNEIELNPETENFPKEDSPEEEYEELEDEDEEDEDIEVDVTEIDMDDEDIDELIAQLQQLKENKQTLNYQLAEDSELVINYTNIKSIGEEE